MIGRSPLQCSCVGAVKPPDKTSIQSKSKDVACDVGRLTRPDIFESRQERRTDGVVVADHCGRSFDGAYDPQQLPAVEQLPMR